MQRLLNLRPRAGARLLLGVLPLLATALLYLGASAARRLDAPENPHLPSLSAMAGAMIAMARPEAASGRIPLLADIAASLGRLASGLTVATGVALVFGLGLGLLPFKRAAWGPFMATLAAVPPIALLPILAAAVGSGDTGMIALIVLGAAPVMIRDLTAHVAAIPEAELVKAQTLGASTWQVALRIALPQALPALIGASRRVLGLAWVLLIAAEALVADRGLGYRVFLAGRQGAMDVVIPYVVVITAFAAGADLALAAISRRAFGWAHPARGR